MCIRDRYWHYLAESFNDPHKVFKKVKKVRSFDEYEAAIDSIFDTYEWIGSKKEREIFTD
jgi:hypothetical protein